MGHIRQLEDHLVDQIAAGEVIERPASVIKELLENAVDAGATEIHIDIHGAGLERIRVTDNGQGMDPDDANLCLQRHATSKLRHIEDLDRMETLGFRGEALPSIASISQLTLQTRPHDRPEGVQMHQGGHSQPFGMAPGTTIEVSDLFHNVPARRKFLKSRSTEVGHINDECLRLALAHPRIRVSWRHDDKRPTTLPPAGSVRERTQMALNSPPLLHVDHTERGIRVLAALSQPDDSRGAANQLYLYVNGRAVRDRALAQAVCLGYQPLLPQGRYPRGVVHLELNPDELDVNVHPRKTLVRFARPREVSNAIRAGVHQALRATGQNNLPPNEQDPSFKKRSDRPSIRYPLPPGSLFSPDANTLAAPRLPTALGVGGPPEARHSQAREETPPSYGATHSPSPVQLLGQSTHGHLMYQTPTHVRVVDLPACRAVLLHRELTLSHEGRPMAPKELVFPVRLELNNRRPWLEYTLHPSVASLGIALSDLGGGASVLRTIPEPLPRSLAPLLGEVLAAATTHNVKDGPSLRTALLQELEHALPQAYRHDLPRPHTTTTAALGETPSLAQHIEQIETALTNGLDLQQALLLNWSSELAH